MRLFKRSMPEERMQRCIQRMTKSIELTTRAFTEFVAFWERNPELAEGVRRLDAELNARAARRSQTMES
jgi:hypothetical protein